ncbi:MAG: phytanoyl-CoA dioxygenase family protein [Gammaproteobacteria bacterium]|nr:phytanoyl-CoA dioxygenase family protein [Gammaproteobacteria bacterium]
MRADANLHTRPNRTGVRRTESRSSLSASQVEGFWRDGWIVAEHAVTRNRLGSLTQVLGEWVEQSRAHSAPFGETLDGRARFDLAGSHTAAAPALRRVDNPPEIDEVYAEVAFDSAMVDMVNDLVGPDTKFHHAKVNLKQPGTDTRVDWHQDFSYTPHTNDHVVTALLMLDDMREDNGCLQVVNGSHREGQKSLWQGATFTGKVSDAEAAEAAARAVPVTGRAGSVCLMHTKLLHGSDANRSARPRGLYICVYSSADAYPLARSPLPNRFEGRVLRGEPSRFARLDPGAVELPAAYRATSFFEVQEKGAT